MELFDILLNIRKTDSFENLGQVIRIDDENYRVNPFDERIKSIFFYKKDEIIFVRIKLSKNLGFDFFKRVFGENFVSLYNHYDEQTFFNYQYEDKVLSFICNNYFVDNDIEALINEVQIVFN